MIRKTGLAAMAAAMLLLGAPAHGAAVSDFYKGKTVTIIVPAGMGGSIGLYALLFSHHIGDHIPGSPTVITQSHPGSAGVKATSYVYNAAPRNGTLGCFLVSMLARTSLNPTNCRWRCPWGP